MRFFKFLLLIFVGLTFRTTAKDCQIWAYDSLATLSESVTTTVRGLGKTSFEASVDAEKQARDVSGGSFTSLGKTTRKAGGTWICDFKISYRKK